MPVIERQGSDIRIRACRPLYATVRPPGSKSLTNRHLLLAALADGTSELRGASVADDALTMVEGLRQLGIAVDIRENERRIDVRGCRGFIPADDADIDTSAAGTAMRFLTGLCTLGRGQYRLDGTPRMRERPIGPLVDALRELGAGVRYELRDGFPPIILQSDGLRGGTVTFREPPSSQFLSAVIMVAPYAAQDVYIGVEGAIPSRPYLDMTLAAMRERGVEALTLDGTRFVVPAPQRYAAGPASIEPDASAATYFWAAAAITGGSVCVEGLTRSSLQGDVRFVDVLEKMGCTVTSDDDSLSVAAPADGRLAGIDVDLNDLPDTVQTLAVTALFAGGLSRIRNVANLRIKETDRLAALQTELSKLGARVELAADEITIEPPAHPTAAAIDTYDDHRMAMSLALAGLRIDGIVIRGADCVSKSFPDYFVELARL
jgi:3-phosphoshikimate 1-carboxyvinyltransferase